MEIINKAVENIAKCWGEGEIKDVSYRPMKYIIRKEIDENTLLHNVVTGELICLDEDELKAFNSLPGEYTADLSELVKHHFAVPLDFDEKSSVVQLRDIIKSLQAFKEDDSIFEYTILPTTACNARCYYCFEAGCKTVTMTEDIASKTADFIIDNHGNNDVVISWFGGEPTVGYKYIDIICEKLKQNNVTFTSNMTSNGYLFDEIMAEKSKHNWNLNDIQITLDGTEEVYNRIKSYVGVKDSPFKRVLKNISLLLSQNIRVTVRVNLGLNNYDDLSILIDDLIDKFGSNDLFRIYVQTLFDKCGYSPEIYTKNDITLLSKKFLFLQKKIDNFRRYGHYSGILPHLKINACMADSDKAVVILPDGSIGMCMSNFAETCGNVFDGITDLDIKNEWKKHIELEKCGECYLYPDCYLIEKCKHALQCDEKKMIEKEIRLDNLIKMIIMDNKV